MGGPTADLLPVTKVGGGEAEVDGVAGLLGVDGYDGGGWGGWAPVRTPTAAGPGSEEAEQDRQQDESVGNTKEDNQKHHLEEGHVDVAGRKGEADHPEDGRDGALNDGEPQGVEAGWDPLLRRPPLLRHVVVADVSGEVDGEPNAHDQVDEGDPVEVNPPPGHVAQHPGLDGEDGEGNPETTERVGNHNEADDHHEGGGDEDGLDGLRHDLEVLVDVDEVRVEHGHLK